MPEHDLRPHPRRHDRAERALLALDRDVREDRELAGQICRVCTASMDIDGAAISLLTSTTARTTLYATDATAHLLEDLQLSLGEGACMQAAATAQPVLVSDMTDPTQTTRWPGYAAAVVEQAHVRAVFALPLQWGTTNLGVLDLYRVAPGPLSRAELTSAVNAADTAAAMLLLGMRTDPDDEPVWDRSWGNRVEIHQATGMVAAQLRISATDALATLRSHAYATDRLLPEVAADVVTRHLAFTTTSRGTRRAVVVVCGEGRSRPGERPAEVLLGDRPENHAVLDHSEGAEPGEWPTPRARAAAAAGPAGRAGAG